MSDFHVIARLIERKLSGLPLSHEEHATLEKWLASDSRNRAEYEALQQDPTGASELRQMLSINIRVRWIDLKKRLPDTRPVISRVPFRPATAAAVFFLIVLSIGVYYLHHLRTQPAAAQPDFTSTLPADSLFLKGRYLVLATGRTYNLDSISNGPFLLDDSRRLTFDSSRLIFPKLPPGQQASFVRVYNTAMRQSQILLSDGSRVWLDARSTIRFPDKFSDTGARTVELVGQGYFEVAASPARPFVIKTRGKAGEQLQVQVLGTRINVNASPDSETVQTTLVTGAARITRGGSGISLLPGHAAIFDPLTSKARIVPADTAKILAWTNPDFNFELADLRDVLNTLGAWYGVHFTLKGRADNFRVDALFSKSKPLADILEALSEGVRMKYTWKSKTECIAESLR